MRRELPALALALALLAAACGPVPNTGQAEPEAATTVKVQNDNLLDMDIYVLSSGQRLRQGIRASAIVLQQVIRHTLGRPRPDTRQYAQCLDQSLDALGSRYRFLGHRFSV